jgi:hypothetical protein
MSNITIFEAGELVSGDYILPEEGMSDLAKSVANNAGGTNRRIQINTNGTFRRVVNGQQIGNAIRGEFTAIVVGMLPKVSRKFYAGDYDPNAKGKLPDCWSNLGDKPEEGAGDKQAANCATCPQNVKGSAPGNRRACRFERRIALILPGLGSEIYQFSIPAGSLFGDGDHKVHPFEGYVKFLTANNASIDRVVTKIAYDLDAQTTTLKFSPARPITRDELALVHEAQADPACVRATKLTVAQTDGVKQLAKPKVETIFEEEEEVVVEVVAPKAKATATPQEVLWGNDGEEEAEYVEVVAETPKKRVSKQAKPEPKADLGSVIDAWGDED